jgi:LysR family transcriptional regulator, glycine cleavage system transcriptional activator
MARTIPPFAALRAFEATARLGRQSDAAVALAVSTSAISHQIRTLEALLGVTLFHRTPAGLTLTPEGAAYHRSVAAALDAISAATDEMMIEADDAPLRIHMYQSLANLWFVPHLREFTARQPDLRVEVLTAPEQISLSGSDIDAQILYTRDTPTSPHADLLFHEVMVPVCAPAYLHSNGPFADVDTLTRGRLISSAVHRGEWAEWAAGAGGSAPPAAPHLWFDNRSNALEAAREGLGIAMDRRPFGEVQKTRGLLIEPLPAAVPTGAAYWFVAGDRSHAFPRVRRMRSWLLALCAGFQPGDPPALDHGRAPD